MQIGKKADRQIDWFLYTPPNFICIVSRCLISVFFYLYSIVTIAQCRTQCGTHILFHLYTYCLVAQFTCICLLIGQKQTNLVEDLEILLPVKFHWIPFSGFREDNNVSANQRPGRPSCFSDRPEKHKLGRGHWDLACCQVSLNSVQRFQRRSRKCLSQSEARAAILFFRMAKKTQTW